MPTRRPTATRVDAQRNAERLLLAARATFRESGSDAQLGEVAKRAGVGIATLYRHFPSKDSLVVAALAQASDETVRPAITAATVEVDPIRALRVLLEALVRVSAEEREMIRAVRAAGTVTGNVSEPVWEALGATLIRARHAQAVRPDITPGDLRRIAWMLMNLTTIEHDPGVWARHITIVLDGLTPLERSPLSPAGDDLDSQAASELNNEDIGDGPPAMVSGT